MDFSLDPEQAVLQEATRGFARAQLAPGAERRERQGGIDHSVIRTMAAQGLMGVNVPSRLGGAEAGAVAYAVALREVAAVDASLAVTMAVTNMVAEVICAFGTREQRHTFVPQLTGGAYFAGAFALSEPGAGSDAGSLTTRAVCRGDTWVLNGEKLWITSGDQAGVLVVWARTDGAGPRGISAFLLEAGAAGMEVGVPETKMGLRASHTVPVSFSDVEIPAANLLGERGDGFRIAMAALDGGRIGIGAQSAGIASAAIDLSRTFSQGRVQFGQPIASHQAIAAKLADMICERDAAWLLTLRAAWLKEQKRPFSQQAAMAKLFASESANRIVREAVQIFGGYGYFEESKVARLFRDCRVTQIYEGTSEVQRLVIGRNLLRE